MDVTIYINDKLVLNWGMISQSKFSDPYISALSIRSKNFYSLKKSPAS